MAPPKKRTPSDLQVQWGKNWRHSSARLSNRKPPPQRPPPDLCCDSCGSCDSCDSCAHNTQAKPHGFTAKTPPQLQRTYVEGSLLQITSPSPYAANLGSASRPTLLGCHRYDLRRLTAATAMAADTYHKRLGKSPIHSRTMSPTL